MPTARKSPKANKARAAYEKPQTAEAYVKKYGADIVRLWVASQDYRNDIVVSEERINKVAKRIAAFAILCAINFPIFTISIRQAQRCRRRTHRLDRWILGGFARLEQEIVTAYDAL